MELVLDASATLAWLIRRVDPIEDQLADEVLRFVRSASALAPALWFPEVANGILVAERRGGVSHSTSAAFLGMVNALPIVQDATRPSAVQPTVLTLARAYKLTGYDATYLELVLRTSGVLATFNRKLANAVRQAGGRVFGDPA
ncbi:MAG TPA: type II toxin-antitoxin system VapC family toxin [Terracidiphilus sp.]|jgi:predicted nucleic acid-binding protein